MSTDATVATSSFVDIETAAFTPVVQIAPIPPGRSDLVWATGHIGIAHALVDIELEAFDAKDWVQLASGGGGFTDFSLSLVVGTTLPADDALLGVPPRAARGREGRRRVARRLRRARRAARLLPGVLGAGVRQRCGEPNTMTR